MGGYRWKQRGRKVRDWVRDKRAGRNKQFNGGKTEEENKRVTKET